MNKTTTRDQRRHHGRKVLDAIDGEAGAKVIDALQEIAPELGHQVIAWGFGEIYARLPTHLDRRRPPPRG